MTSVRIRHDAPKLLCRQRRRTLKPRVEQSGTLGTDRNAIFVAEGDEQTIVAPLQGAICKFNLPGDSLVLLAAPQALMLVAVGDMHPWERVIHRSLC
jgi:hypothetical protein